MHTTLLCTVTPMRCMRINTKEKHHFEKNVCDVLNITVNGCIIQRQVFLTKGFYNITLFFYVALFYYSMHLLGQYINPLRTTSQLDRLGIPVLKVLQMERLA